jgi:hypothetical protein
MEHQRVTGFWMERGWIRDMGNLAYPKHEGVSDFFGKPGSFGFGGVLRVIPNVGGMSGVVGWPSVNTNIFLIAHRDLKFGVSDKGIKGVIPLDKEPRVVDELKG